MRIKKLDFFIAKQFGLLFAGTFFICLFVLMMQFLWKYVDDLIGKGLSLDVLAQFFWYMGLLLIPQALPLTLLLSSLIAFGNLGESSELTAIKAAGVSLLQSLKPLIVIAVIVTLGSFYFQEVVGPSANRQFGQLLLSMRQKNPELEIPEGVFYSGIPNCNIYVHHKDMETGMLYGIMIYRMNNSYQDAAIILADSGMLQSTAEKKHLVLTLHNGEWFENMKSGEIGQTANIPYRREAFINKKIVLDFDGDFNLADASSFSSSAKTKSLRSITQDIDSLTHYYDSIGRRYYEDAKTIHYNIRPVAKNAPQTQLASTRTTHPDSVFDKKSNSEKLQVITQTREKLNNIKTDFEFKALITSDGDRIIRQHKIEAINKFTLALSCLIFFFIGAPLGAIIRKGGLGIPVIISVIVFIIYYILDNTGSRMARGGMWTIGFGKGLAPAVLIPLAAFFTYKANNDSVVFNMDLYKSLLAKMLGIRSKRHIFGKEVIINDPDYAKDLERLRDVSEKSLLYEQRHQLLSAPNPISAFFKYEPDNEVERMVQTLGAAIEDLSNTKDKHILHQLNNYPVVSAKAHTRPFEKRWMNTLLPIILPLGVFLYCRMWLFRMRLLKDLHNIRDINEKIGAQINKQINKNQ